MILCICLSPAIDITYHLDRVLAGATNRVRSVARRPGGKAVNVARLLHALGEPVRVVAPVGGHPGAEFAEELAALGLPADLVPNSAATRTTVAVVDDLGTSTMFVEPAPMDCWPALLSSVHDALPLADAVVVSGRVPTGAAPDAVGELVRLAAAAGRPSIVDTSGPPLLDALRAGATMIKPNADELSEIAGHDDAPRAAATMAAAFGTTMVVSLGGDGVLVADGSAVWRARPARPLVGNPTGAGDALVAGLARGLRAQAPIHETVRDAVALSAAAVLCAHAGEVDPTQYAQLREQVLVESPGVLR